MKKLFAVLFVIVLSSPLYGQGKERGYGSFDFETGAGVTVATSKVPEETNGMGGSLYFEGRWQLEPQPIDVGFHLGVSTVQRDDEHGYRAIPLMAIADWQFGRGKRFNPYVGLGMGISSNGFSYDTGGHWPPVSFAVSPRVGIRCFRFLNVSAGWLLTEKHYSRLYANLGFYF